MGSISISPISGMILRSTRLDLVASSNDEVSISINSIFETNNANPTMSIDLSYSEEAEIELLGNISFIADVIYCQQETGRLYMVGGYASVFQISAVRHETGADYTVNLSSHVASAFNYAYSQNSSLTIDQVGIIGRMSLYAELSGAIGRSSDTQFISMQLIFDTESVEGTFGLAIPSGSTFTRATYEGVELDRADPNVATMPFPIVPGTMLDGHLYAEWSIPSGFTSPPCSFVVPGLFGAVVGTIFTIIIKHRKPIWVTLRRYAGRFHAEKKEITTTSDSHEGIENK